MLDEATERMYPALTFVAHLHCQNVLTNYWHGNYCGSHAAITKSDLHMLLLQIVLQVVYTIIACLGGFAAASRRPSSMRLRRSRQSTAPLLPSLRTPPVRWTTRQRTTSFAAHTSPPRLRSSEIA